MTAAEKKASEPKALTREEQRALVEESKVKHPPRPQLEVPASAIPPVDRAGMLLHLVEKYSRPGHPASYEVVTEENQVRVKFVYEREGKERWVKVRKTAVGMNIDDAAGNLAAVLANDLKED